ncbi:MAG: hypothetical protein E7487_11595 [Ruminococcaceae bacterium]|nr:hypothetical protein [Oscillospiraceae bacterium]
MREQYNTFLKKELKDLAVKTRKEQGITQRKMSEILEMNETSYSNIETGVYMCGTLTTVLLLMEQKDPSGYLKELELKFQELEEGEEG